MQKSIFITILLVVNFIAIKGECEFRPGLPETNNNVTICSKVASDFDGNLQFSQNVEDQEFITLQIRESTIPILPAKISLGGETDKQVRRFFLHGLGIESVSPGAFSGFSSLLQIGLTSNKLAKITRGVFNDLPSLQILNLTDNSIEEIEENSFSGSGITYLYLNNNNLKIIHTHVTQGLAKLHSFDVSGNPLEEFQDLGSNNVKYIRIKNTTLKRFNANLKELDLGRFDISGSELEEIDFALFPTVYLFNASSNNIKLVKNWGKLSGYTIDLDHNQITEVDLIGRARSISLRHNKINQIKANNAYGNERLYALDLSFNEISNIPTEINFSWLHKLSLANNQITALREKTFTYWRSLVELNLDNNAIKTIEPNTFVAKRRSKISKLSLVNNQLEEVTRESLAGLPENVTVYLKGNPLAQKDISSVTNVYKNVFVN